MTLDEINVLGNLLNTTFGRSSTVATPTESIVATLDGDLVVFTYTTIMTLHGRETHRAIINNQCEIAKKSINNKCKDVCSAFNKHFKSKCKFHELECTHHVDPVSFRPEGLPSQSVFKMTAICELR